MRCSQPVPHVERRTWSTCCVCSSHPTLFSRRPFVRDLCSYDYAIVRVVPRVEREEFINVGVIVSCPALDFLEARIELDETRLRAVAGDIDIDSLRTNLASIPTICIGGPQAGPIG